ncbi:hypothetical protein MPTK1_2g03000 [Marchantia polymorpha subsp. ruderalis]|uniref:Uncharacterized protein n=1 Tax=Marchantia polymorpha TaxID=3197 RepID=A0A2R6WM95_MARPO|nr:hypothetical protein MARPO_0075s0061 [Marchantia polymorpha]BBN00903.1 hypothetical protein Mp_2g03000 [Marchantia polymorpha subsp. ruderalis]|eukprot:PTQ34957.1 hypothetical protein MARPO_0075s0061 [Marchantia polymorpha]
MWSPAPKPKVVRRPLDSFNHQRPKLKKKKNPLEYRPENHRGHRYFGIRHSDITDYLEKIVPSHAFAPANINAGPPTNFGKGRLNEQARPSTAPAAIPWFGRTSTDVSDWLRQLPPAHLGADPDDKPLPHFPTRSSIVTDNRWQTKDFPPVPNVLWHYWSDRPSSAPLATAPQQVQFQTIIDAIRKNKPKPKDGAAVTSEALPSGSNAPTPRSARGGSPAANAPPTNCGNGTEPHPGGEPDKGADAAAAGLKLPGFSSRPATPLAGAGDAFTPDASSQFCQCGKLPAGAGGSPKSVASGRDPEFGGYSSARLCSSCGKPPDPGAPSPSPSPRSPKRPETPQSAEKGVNKLVIPEPALGGITARSAAGTPRPHTPRLGDKKPAASSQRPPPSPIITRQRGSPLVCQRHPPAPFHEVITNSKKAPAVQDSSNDANAKTNGNLDGATAEDLRRMNPDSFATKVVWQDKFRKHNKGNPWAIRAY